MLSTELAGGMTGILAEIASCQLEWSYLAHTTGSKKHFEHVRDSSILMDPGAHVAPGKPSNSKPRGHNVRAPRRHVADTLEPSDRAAWRLSARLCDTSSADKRLDMPGRETWSVGAAADSAHEYLLKQYLLTGQTDVANLEMCTYTGYNHRAPTDVRSRPQTCSPRTRFSRSSCT